MSNRNDCKKVSMLLGIFYIVWQIKTYMYGFLENNEFRAKDA